MHKPDPSDAAPAPEPRQRTFVLVDGGLPRRVVLARGRRAAARVRACGVHAHPDRMWRTFAPARRVHHARHLCRCHRQCLYLGGFASRGPGRAQLRWQRHLGTGGPHARADPSIDLPRCHHSGKRTKHVAAMFVAIVRGSTGATSWFKNHGAADGLQ